MKPDMSVTGELSVGTPSIDWLGVPLKTGERAFGVLAVQTYTPGVRYEERDKEMLQFVSTQIATAIERKRAEETLRNSEERFRALVERSGDAIALLDNTGKITYASPSTTTVLGRSADAITGSNAFDLLHPDDVPAVLAALATVRRKPGASVLVHSRFRHGDDTWHEGEGTVTNRLTDSAVRAVVFNYRDVTERHRLETQLRQAQKMEAIGRLAGGVAHDFNNMLTAVFGYVDMLREELPADSRAQQDLAEVRKAAERAAALTKQLLAFSRQQVLEPVVLRPNELLEDLEKMLQRMIGEDVELTATLPGDVVPVWADDGLVEQVIFNLAANARDAMPDGGVLSIETRNVRLDAGHSGRLVDVPAGDYVMLRIRDTGVGMDDTVQANVFEPFFTTKPPGKGTGLGLATVFGIVQHSGGQLNLTSAPGAGTTVDVYLPRAPAGVETEPEAPQHQPPGGGSETILLVEDDERVRAVTRRFLMGHGYLVLEADDGTQALLVARGHKATIDLVITDVVMPRMSGLQFVTRLREIRPDSRVLYISGYADGYVTQERLAGESVALLKKPFTEEALLRRVRAVLDQPRQAEPS